MVKHDKNCSFIEFIKDVKDGFSFKYISHIDLYEDVPIGDIFILNDNIEINEKGIELKNPHFMGSTLDFNFCPECGVKLKKEEVEKVNETNGII